MLTEARYVELGGLTLITLMVVAGCSILGPANDGDAPPIPSKVEYEGLLFRLHSELVKPDSLRLWLTATNVSDTTISRWMSGPCLVAPEVAYHEGRWSDPVWNWTETPAGSSCVTLGVKLDLAPGETAEPELWDQGILVRWILGDSLETGLYRMGLLDVAIDHEVGTIPDPNARFTPDMIANEPVRLEYND